MSSNAPDGEHDGPEERLLDGLLRASGSRPVQQAPRPGDDEILAVIAGTATEKQRQTVLHAMARSRSLRQEIAERLGEAQRLDDADVQRLFDEVDVGPVPPSSGFLRPRKRSGAVGKGPTLVERILAVLYQPAFAYGFMLLLAAYPVYSWLKGPEETLVPSSVTVASQSVFVRGFEEMTLRDGGAGPQEAVIRLDSAAEILELTVWAPEFMRPEPEDTVRLSVVGEGELSYEEADFQGYLTIDGQDAFRVSLRRVALQPGALQLRLERVMAEEGSSKVIVSRLRLTGGD